MPARILFFLLLSVFLTGCGRGGDTPPPAEPATQALQAEDPNDTFDRVLDDMTRAFFYHKPELATSYGVSELIVPRTAHRLTNRSLLGETGRREELGAALEKLEALDPAALTPDRRRTHAVVTTIVGGALAPAEVVDHGTTFDGFGLYFLAYPINQLSGPTVDIPNFLNSQQPVGNAEEAEAYLVRLAAVDEALDGALEYFRRGVASGAIPPDFVVEKSLAVVETFTGPPPEQNALYAAFVERLDAASVDGADAFAERALEIVTDEVLPAYERIGDYLGEIAASAPHEAGIWRIPEGEALYAAMIRHLTDDERSPAEIHQTGLDEVERITAEMDTILKEQGYDEGSVGERMLELAGEERFIYPNDDAGRAALLSDARAQVEGMYARLPDYFRRLPKHPVEVRRVPEFSQGSAPTGYYDQPAPDGSRPGVYWLNLRDTASHPRFALPTLTYHEALPGHHMHLSNAVEQDVPPLVWALFSNASGEGWALYAEQLAAEMGAYDDDPYGDLGRLQAELHRAVRLVVDTGMHAKRWSREQAIEYMMDVEGIDETVATAEIERYAVWPAQALGYKLGMLKILELRERARSELGDAFDIRDFNQAVLDVASTPLPYIEATLEDWIASRQQ